MTETKEQATARLKTELGFAATHDCLGCRTCWFANQEQLGKGPCCEHINVQFSDDSSTCLSYRAIDD